MAGEFGIELGLVDPAPAHHDEVFLRIFRTKGGPFHLAWLMAWRHANLLQGEPRTLLDGFVRGTMFALAGRNDEHRDRAWRGGRLVQPREADRRAARGKHHGAARQHGTEQRGNRWPPRGRTPARQLSPILS